MIQTPPYEAYKGVVDDNLYEKIKALYIRAVENDWCLNCWGCGKLWSEDLFNQGKDPFILCDFCNGEGQ